MTALQRVTDPAEEPLTVSEAKTHLKVSGSTEDSYISGLITAARLICEEFTGRALVTQGWRLWCDNFPGGNPNSMGAWWDGVREAADHLTVKRAVRLPRPPLISVEAVTIYDDDDNSEEFPESEYFVDTSSEPGRLALRRDAAWPVAGRDTNGIRIDFTAGYGAASAVPKALKQGMLAHIAHLYENRGEGLGPAGEVLRGKLLPEAASALYLPYRVFYLG